MKADNAGSRCMAQLAIGESKAAPMGAAIRQSFIRKNGPRRWSPYKAWITKRMGHKCWYTEVELVGAPLTIDHFRPVSNYWWLAFSADNYRLACSYSNSPQHNPLYGCAGGKGDAFPLLPPGRRATSTDRRRRERPVLLDPCDKNDCEFVVFQADGRPVVNPLRAHEPSVRLRVEESKVLLNLDHPDFNTKREQLCNDIEDDVKTYEALPSNSPLRDIVSARLRRRIGSKAPFSSAARCYLKFHRHLKWVDEMLAEVK